MWTFEYRLVGDENWRPSVRPYDKIEDAAAGAAHCQAILALNGIILECRLVPHQKEPKQPHIVRDAPPAA